MFCLPVSRTWWVQCYYSGQKTTQMKARLYETKTSLSGCHTSLRLSPSLCQSWLSMPTFFHLGESKRMRSALFLSSPRKPDQSLLLWSFSPNPSAGSSKILCNPRSWHRSTLPPEISIKPCWGKMFPKRGYTPVATCRGKKACETVGHQLGTGKHYIFTLEEMEKTCYVGLKKRF